jgi:hypothetical protein
LLSFPPSAPFPPPPLPPPPPRPADALRRLAERVRAGGSLLVLDYEAHDDETLRDEQADLWLGFAADDLRSYAQAAGLENVSVTRLPGTFHPAGPDAHLTWHVLAARRPNASQ